ncbi:hypothetical protein PPACK8108_LOCUS20250 [Phakopsora pachyrhizi]|uniref:AMP-dependent synthetase/ligase domain-containing protein n=1 Tax=Phakopsora pachyrhizi TaxID=170000 RepID=A0AAV0BFY6_PHAPC|nr:hypothetical protein PPACK8108_LOCUS20250 [Phakopsora pachyrhizi]
MATCLQKPFNKLSSDGLNQCNNEIGRGRNNEPVESPRSPSCSPCYDTEADLPLELIGPEEYGSPTLWDCFLRGYQCSDSSPCMGTRLESTTHKSAVPSQAYSWLSYGEVYQKIIALSTGLREIISMRTSNVMKADVEVGLLQIRVAICLPNSPIWTISEYACYRNSSVVVSINEQSNSKKVSKIINQTRPAVILLTAEKFKLLIKHRARELGRAKRLISSLSPLQIKYHSPVVCSPKSVILEGDKTITLPKVPTSDDLNPQQSELQFEGDDYTCGFNQSSSTEADWSFGSRRLSLQSSSIDSNQTFELYHNILSKDPIYVIIDFPEISKTNQAEATELGVVMYDIQDVEGIGSAKCRNESYQNCGIKEADDVLKFESQNRFRPISETIAQIIYSSGTTGEPKPCVITQGNFAANLASFTYLSKQKLLPTLAGCDLVQFSYLPLFHIYEKVSQAFVLYNGGSIGFSSISSLRFLEDITLLKPTFLSTTPQFLMKQILDNRLNSLNNFNSFKSSIESYLLQKAIEEKVKVLKQGNGEKVWLWDKFVLKYLRDSLGGRLKWIVSGTSALTNHVTEMLSASLSVKISEGYGLTETCSAASISLLDSLGILSNDGNVGKPLPCCEIKLKDVEGIYTKDDKPFARGQIFIRGHNVFKGYFIPRTQTEDERIHSPKDSSGWFATGDIGYFDKTGRLHLVDRLINTKDWIFKQQINHHFNVINLKKIELILLNSVPEIDQVFVSSDSENSSNFGQLGNVVANVVVNLPNFFNWLQNNGEAKEIETNEVKIQMGEEEEEACEDEAEEKKNRGKNSFNVNESIDYNSEFSKVCLDNVICISSTEESIKCQFIERSVHDSRVSKRFLQRIREIGKLNGLKL